MNRQDRKSAVAAYKERKRAAGIFAVRCTGSAQAWVGRAPDLGAIQNRLWFALRQGASPHRTLQAAWNAQGEAQFVLQALERLEDEPDAYLRDRKLKERLAHWAGALNAETI